MRKDRTGVRRPAAVAMLAAVAGCGPGPDSAAPPVEGDAASSLPVPEVPAVRFAERFSVSAGPGYRLLRASPDPGALGPDASRAWAADVDSMVLVDRGDAPRVPSRLEHLPRFEVPVRSVTTNRDADALRVKELGHLDRLRAIGGSGIYDSDLRARVESGELGSVGSALHRTTNVEFLLTERIEAAFFRVASLEHADQFERIRDVGGNAVPVFAWAERSYLGRAEWLAYVALFLGAEAQAEAMIDGMVARRDSLIDRIGDSPAVPAVWAYRSGDRWLVHRNSLESELLRDARGENVLADGGSAITDGTGGFNEGVPMTDEEFLIAAANAEYWITWDHSDEHWPSRGYLDDIPAYREGRVYHHRLRVRPGQGGDDWYEGAQVDPVTVLADLVALLHPGALPDHEFMWLAPLERTR